MTVPRRTLLGSAATASALAVAGCSSFQQEEQVLLVENQTDSARDVTVTVRHAPENGTNATTGGNATTTAGTSSRFVVDFEYEVSANDRREALQVLPKDGEYVVEATVPDVGRGRGTYRETESVRVTVTDGGVTVESYRPE